MLRAQIHVNIANDGEAQITIFSKSGRNSTKDRNLIHPLVKDLTWARIILSALGVELKETETDALLKRRSLETTNTNNLTKACILEGEMCVFNEDEDEFDEFDTIRELKGGRNNLHPVSEYA